MMIAAWLCGAMFGALAYRAWWVKPRTLRAEPWDVLCGEELFRFDQGDTIEIVGQAPIVLPIAEDWKATEDPAHYGEGWGPHPYDAASAEHYT